MTKQISTLAFRVELSNAPKYLAGPEMVRLAEDCAKEVSPVGMSYGEFGFNLKSGNLDPLHAMFMREAGAKVFAEKVNDLLGVVLDSALVVSNPLGAQEFTLSVGCSDVGDQAGPGSLLGRILTQCGEMGWAGGVGATHKSFSEQIEFAAKACGVSLNLTSRTPTTVSYLAIDSDVLRWSQAIDLSDELHRQGYPLRLRVKMTRDGKMYACGDEGQRLTPVTAPIAQAVLGAPAINAIKRRFPLPSSIICDMKDLLRAYRCASPQEFAQNVQQGYPREPWISALKGGQAVRMDVGAQSGSQDLVRGVAGVEVGADGVSQALYFPFTAEQLDGVFKAVDQEVIRQEECASMREDLRRHSPA